MWGKLAHKGRPDARCGCLFSTLVSLHNDTGRAQIDTYGVRMRRELLQTSGLEVIDVNTMSLSIREKQRRHALREPVPMDDGWLCLGDKERLVRTLNRLEEVSEAGTLPDLGGGHAARDPAGDGGVVARGGRVLVERDDADGGKDRPAPEWRVEHYFVPPMQAR